MYHRSILYSMVFIPIAFAATAQVTDQAAFIKHHDISVTLDPAKHTIKGTDRITAALSPQQDQVGFLLNKSITVVKVADRKFPLKKRPVTDFQNDYQQNLDAIQANQFQYYVVKIDKPDSLANFTIAFEGIIFDTLKTEGQRICPGICHHHGTDRYAGRLPGRNFGMDSCAKGK